MKRLLGAIQFHLFTPAAKKEYRKKIAAILGYHPTSYVLYEQAFTHLSASKKGIGGAKSSNERLEYLGDAVLDLAVAEILYRKFPFKGEGYLTEMKSKIVSRKQLSQLSRNLGIPEVLKTERNISVTSHVMTSLSGNALEAIIGAIYLDLGWRGVQNFIFTKLIRPYINLDELESLNRNYKSIINQWAQKEKKKLSFKVVSEEGKNHKKKFNVALYIDDKETAMASHYSKKTAEKIAAQVACERLKLIEE